MLISSANTNVLSESAHNASATDLVVQMAQLPSMTVEEVKQTVDKVGAYVDALSAAKRATTDQNTIDEIDAQIRKYSAFKIRCQMELGERTAKMEKAQGERNDLEHSNDIVTKSKEHQLADIGMSKMQASRFEQLVKPENRPIVERYLDKAETEKEVPTFTGALKVIKETKKPHVANNSKDDEWYTPEKYIEAARTVMGSIDLDPASNDFANETVKAKTFFDEEQNGLGQKWFGNIWLNPPYSTSLIQAFAEKLNSSDFEQGIVLVNNATETQWFKSLIEKASAIVFSTGRIKYNKRDGEHGAPLQGQAFIYYGDNVEKFSSVFGKFGWVAIPHV